MRMQVFLLWAILPSNLIFTITFFRKRGKEGQGEYFALGREAMCFGGVVVELLPELSIIPYPCSCSIH